MLKYPVKSDQLTFYETNNNEYIMKCADESIYVISQELYEALDKLDGKKPLYINGLSNEESEVITKALCELSIIRTKRYRQDGWYTLWSLYFFSKQQINQCQKICNQLANFIYFGSIPTAISIFLIAFMKEPTGNKGFSWIVYWLFILVSLVIHEGGHAIAAIAAAPQCYITEIGVTFFKVFPIGAYVSIEEGNATSIQKLKIYAAGVETELIYAAVMFLISRYSDFHKTFEICTIITLFMVASNLIPYWDLDGQYLLKIIKEIKKRK